MCKREPRCLSIIWWSYIPTDELWRVRNSSFYIIIFLDSLHCNQQKGIHPSTSIFLVLSLSLWFEPTFLCHRSASLLSAAVGSACCQQQHPAALVLGHPPCRQLTAEPSCCPTLQRDHQVSPGGLGCQFVRKGKAPTLSLYLSSLMHLFRSRNDSEPKMSALLLVWVQTVQMASVSMMSISGLAMGHEHLLLGAQSLSLAWQEYT